ncbi:serine/threonine-protein kinase [Paractinoplanes rhizophilus]|uniref:Serine/threonine-protein kinase n=1 Tax=Paractinoplanes rhizophilus TaxID=1416877 RepID=A0ABW2HM05_9ACTN|nr:serine/threonine-protein kinase [Actinoplanes sp.]
MATPLRPGDGTRIGRYDLVGRLGEGGMGTVYLGRSPQGRPVAIKTVRIDFTGDAEFRARFRGEVNRARQVPPFSTAEVLDADPDHQPPYLVVEYVDGPSLATKVREDGPLTGSGLHGLAIGIATALTAIHGAGVIHRDLKPGNVLLAPGGTKVIDFGIARAFEATSRHTRTDQMVGTVAYMAPERFDPAPGGRPTTAAADIFAWGAVVAYAATGRTPFDADSATATAVRILTQPPDLTGLPPALHDAVEWALAKEPQDRPTARQLLDLLVAAPTSASPASPSAAPPVPSAAGVAPSGPVPPDTLPPGRRGRRLRTAAIVGLALAALAGAGLVAAHELSAADKPEPPAAAPSGGPASRPTPSPVDTHAAILRGKHRTLIHLAEADRDLALDLHDNQVVAGDGTGAKSLFVLVPYGVDYLIRTLRDTASAAETCLGVKIVPDGPASLAPADCEPTAATVFSLSAANGTDDKGRPTYWMTNEAYGFVQYSPTRRAVFVQEVGDARPLSTFSLVDRGPD